MTFPSLLENMLISCFSVVESLVSSHLLPLSGPLPHHRIYHSDSLRFSCLCFLIDQVLVCIVLSREIWMKFILLSKTTSLFNKRLYARHNVISIPLRCHTVDAATVHNKSRRSCQLLAFFSLEHTDTHRYNTYTVLLFPPHPIIERLFGASYPHPPCHKSSNPTGGYSTQALSFLSQISG